MPKRTSPKQLLDACRMSFEGVSNSEIAVKYDVNEATVSNWRKLELWKEFEGELVKAYKQQVLETDLATLPVD